MLTHLLTQRSPPSLTHFPTSATPSLHSHLSISPTHLITLLPHLHFSPSLTRPTHQSPLSIFPPTLPHYSFPLPTHILPLSLLFPLPNSPYLCSVTSPLIHLSSRSPYSPPPFFTLRQPLFYFTSSKYLYRQYLHLSSHPYHLHSLPLLSYTHIPLLTQLHTFHVLTLPLLSSYLSHLPPLTLSPVYIPSIHSFSLLSLPTLPLITHLLTLLTSPPLIPLSSVTSPPSLTSSPCPHPHLSLSHSL